LICVCNY